MKPSRKSQDNGTATPKKPHSSKNPKNRNDEKLYRPMLLRFRCIGGFSLSDPPEHNHRLHNSSNNNHQSSNNSNSNSNNSEKFRTLQKRCLGLHTRLEPIGEYPAMTANEALENFTFAASHDRFETANGFGGLHHHHQTQPRRTDNNDDDDGEDGPLTGILPKIVDPKLVEMQRHLDDDEDDDYEHDHEHDHPSFRRGGIGGTGTTGILTHHSRFYGSTHIGVLLLRPHNTPLPATTTTPNNSTHPTIDTRTNLPPHLQQHQLPPQQQQQPHPTFPPGSVKQYGSNNLSPQTLSESILYAVSPQNTLGLSIRELNRDDETNGTTLGGTFSTIRIGVVEVSLASRHEGVYIEDEEEDEEEEKNYNNNNVSQEDVVAGRTSSSVQQRSLGDGKGRTGGNTPTTQQQQQQQSPKDLTEVAEEYYDRVVGMAGKLAKSMAQNATFLKDELTDDFPNRFGKGAEKVVQGFGKQMGRMEKFGRDLYSFVSDGEGGGGGGGGSGNGR